jgi:hypothetical protein
LPLDNEAVDIQGPEYIRTFLSEKLSKRGYRIIEAERVDEVLKSFGVTDAGQIKHINLQQVGKKLGVDGIFYGIVKDFSFKHVVVAGLRRVEVHLELLNVQTGKIIWVADAEASSSGMSLAVVEKAFGSTPLANEVKEVVLKLIQKLPRR